MFSRVHVVFQMADSILNAVSERVFTLCVKYELYTARILPLPLRPTNRRSLKRATWFFMTAVALRSSAAKFSSLPAAIETSIPSGISPSATTLNATGSVLLHLQCDGNTLQTKFGESVFTSSPGYSASASMSDRSPLIFRGPAFSVTVVMVLQCVNHKSEPPEYVWQVWHTTGRWNKLKCFWPTTPLRFWHLLCLLVLRFVWCTSYEPIAVGDLTLSHAHRWHSSNELTYPAFRWILFRFLERSCGLVPSRESLFDDIEELNCGEFRQLADSLKHVGTTNGEIVEYILYQQTIANGQSVKVHSCMRV